MADPAVTVLLPDSADSKCDALPASAAARPRRMRVVWGVAGCAWALVAIGLALVPANGDVPEAAFADFAVPELTAALLFSPLGAWLAVRPAG